MTRRNQIYWNPARLMLALVLSGSVLGCASLAGLEPPDVTLSSLDITEITVFETTLQARLRITNPNPESLTIEGASFKLSLDDRRIGTGTTAESLTVDRLSSAVVDATFHINNAAAIFRLQEALQSQAVSYGLTGTLFTTGTFGTSRIKVDTRGRIDLAEAAEAPSTPADGAS